MEIFLGFIILSSIVVLLYGLDKILEKFDISIWWILVLFIILFLLGIVCYGIGNMACSFLHLPVLCRFE